MERRGTRITGTITVQSVADSVILTPTAMSGIVTLLCWVIESHTKQIFPVEIGRDKMWGSVKDAIKEKKKPEFGDIAADTLDLWKVRQCVIRNMSIIILSRSPSIVPNFKFS